MASRRVTEAEDVQTARETTTIELTKAAMKGIDDYVKRRGGMRGMKKHILSELVEWFGRVPDPVKSIATNNMERGFEQQYAAALRQLADEIESQREPTIVIRK